MANSYVAVTIFAIIAMLIPLSMLFFSRLVRPQSRNTPVETLPYESSEVSVGQKVEIMHEYMHYFVIFLSFEIISVIVIIWSTFTKPAISATGIYMIGILAFGFIFVMLMLRISRSKGG